MADEEKREKEELSADGGTRAEERLLYDPLFETPPDTVIRDTPGKGFFGKAAVKKTVFVIVLSLFVGVSIALSFHSLTKPRFKYEDAEGGLMLAEFNAEKTDAVLEIGPVFREDGAVTEGKTVSVRPFAVCGNETTAYILIGKDVREIPNTAFYNCSALQAVIVDPANPNYRSEGGVLYRTENGSPAELMLYPARNYLYRALLALGEAAPGTAEEARALAKRAAELDGKSGKWLASAEENYPACDASGLSESETAALSAALKYEIPAGVTRIGEMAFAECGTLYEITIPEGVRTFSSMAFFKCGNLRALRIPDSAEEIGSDAFSYCEKVPYIFIPSGVKQIGHHAFFGCGGVSEVYMACGENDLPDLGQDWLPQRKKLFMHNVPIVYNAERRDGR